MMGEAKFTKGEWAVEDGKIVICNNSTIAFVYSGSNIPYSERINANAHLIAAAPEMYEALFEISKMDSSDLAYMNENSSYISELLERARGEK